MKNNFFRYAVGILALVCVVGVIPKSVAAVSEPIQPMYLGIVSVQPNVTINSLGNATCKDTIRVKNDYSVSITWELQSRGSGSWGTIATWYDSGEGTRSLTRNRYVSVGYDYRLKTSIKIYDSRDVLVESVLDFSEIVHY